MKTHTNQFKTNLKNMGKEINSIITYGQTTLHDELYSISYHYEANILKSVMKQLDIESSVDIPLETIINFQSGIKVENSYEYLDYGNYVVYKSEKQEDKGTYKITCYDKMLYAMKQNESLGITYPITLKNYLIAIATKIGLQVENTNFQNQNKQIQSELYLGLEYTYRDILDEIAQATGSIICINENDKIEVRYPNETNDTIDEEFLKDINVKFGNKYGKINSIVLSRSGESDNVYLRDEESVLEDGLCEVKIVDNQILNWNDRSEYLQGILSALDGFHYYINDFNSTGILYYDVFDTYNVQIGEQTYKCVMLNDEINITSGIEEIIYTDMPSQSETDYTKADKTDLRINQTYIIADKQNQQIQSLVSQIGDRSQKTTTITQDIDGINSQVEDLEDLTKTVTGNQTVTINDAYPNESFLELHIYGNNSVFNYLYPRDDLYPDDTLYPFGDSKIRFYNDKEDRTIELGIEEVLRSNNEVKDELYIDYKGNVSLIRRVNDDGTTKTTPVTTLLGQLHFKLIEGNNTFTILNYIAQIEVKYAVKSTYTEIFATRVEMDSEITQTAHEIDLSVNKKLENYSTTTQMNAQIQLTADSINSEVSKKVGNDEVISRINQSAEQITIDASKINLNGSITANGAFKIDTEGNMECNDAKMKDSYMENIAIKSMHAQDYSFYFNSLGKVYGKAMELKGDIASATVFVINNDENGNEVASTSDFFFLRNTNTGVTKVSLSNDGSSGHIYCAGAIEARGSSSGVSTDGSMFATSFINSSENDLKENIHKLKDISKNKSAVRNGIDILKSADIYEYNFKGQEHKQIGVIIGKKYNTPEEILSENKKGIDLYSMISIVWKAVQEQQEQIEELQKEIKELKGEK